jgi:hypothetical protein
MRGFLTRIIDQRLRRLTVVMLFGLVVVATAGVVADSWNHPKFNEADLAVARAQLLIRGSACGTPGERTTESCERLLRKAEELLTKAREAVTAAATAAVGGDVILRR